MKGPILACAWVVVGGLASFAHAASPPTPRAALQVIATCNVEDIVVTLLGESAEWKVGLNRVLLEFDSAPRKHLVDVGEVLLEARSGSASRGKMSAQARVRRDAVAGRYLGTIDVPQAGIWEVVVSWPRRGGRQSGTLSVVVR